MKVALIVASYDSGHYASGLGAGPEAILSAGLAMELEAQGHDIAIRDVGRIDELQSREISTGFAVCRRTAELVDTACRDGRFPIVLAGNCLTAVGAVAGERADALLWFDQHGDLNTPETSPYGFLDGMAFAATMGLCWRPMTAAVPNFKPIDPANCLLVDARDLDADEVQLIDRLALRHVRCDEAADAAEAVLRGRTRPHLHLDLDVHAPDSLRVNRYASPGGPGRDQLRATLCAIARMSPVAGMTITAYEPDHDPEGRVPPAVAAILTDLIRAMEAVR